MTNQERIARLEQWVADHPRCAKSVFTALILMLGSDIFTLEDAQNKVQFDSDKFDPERTETLVFLDEIGLISPRYARLLMRCKSA